ncbi:Cytochrome c oxidase assembly protein cox19 [Apiotrichum porosum]|uniref:Cytochrome c oxidase assembly protein cox19 n=1 Tax=Apiotrichum porosum TaxID=105984 RepID=A0A427XLZ2_9TREE|nr:Cytochrome c oxidase assembly protein cox19 [Apiotrichum porosum]RSH79792.1 Cytochrome c oxidase assembly protein cox19 [Apiotrichum porosum]
MSFGRPGGLADTFKVLPPQRGSFPLDHDGDCKTFMLSYMKCLKANKSDSGECRLEARGYLQCRMDHGLMDQDDMQNLGLGDVGGDKGPAVAASTTQTGGAAASSDPAGTASKSADKTSRI